MSVFEHYGFSRRKLLKLGMGGVCYGGLLSLPRGLRAADITNADITAAQNLSTTDLPVSAQTFANVRAEVDARAASNQPFAGCVEIDPGTIIERAQASNKPAGSGADYYERDREVIAAYQRSFSESGDITTAPAQSATNVARSLGFSRGPAAAPTSQPARIPSAPDRAILTINKLWDPGSEVTYSYLRPNATIKAMFEGDPRGPNTERQQGAFRVWADVTGLKFREVSSGGDIRISFLSGFGHYSCIGKDSRIRDVFKHGDPVGKESMNIDPSDGGSAEQKFATCLHELGHAMGLQHEHLHPQLRFDEAAVISFYARTQNWDAATTRHNILSRLTNLKDFYFSDPDKVEPLSIMMYWGLQQFVISGLGAGERLPSSPNLLLSKTDADFTAKKYGHSRGTTTETEKEVAETKSRRAALKASDAVALATDGKALDGEIKEDGDLKLYKLSIASGAVGDHVVETVENAGVGITLELFDGTDFAVEKAIQISKPGDGVAVLDGYLKAQLKAQDYYVIARHHHERGRGKFKLRAQTGTAIPSDEKGTPRKLRQQIADLQKTADIEIKSLTDQIDGLKAASPRTLK